MKKCSIFLLLLFATSAHAQNGLVVRDGELWSQRGGTEWRLEFPLPNEAHPEIKRSYQNAFQNHYELNWDSPGEILDPLLFLIATPDLGEGVTQTLIEGAEWVLFGPELLGLKERVELQSEFIQALETQKQPTRFGMQLLASFIWEGGTEKISQRALNVFRDWHLREVSSTELPYIWERSKTVLEKALYSEHLSTKWRGRIFETLLTIYAANKRPEVLEFLAEAYEAGGEKSASNRGRILTVLGESPGTVEHLAEMVVDPEIPTAEETKQKAAQWIPLVIQSPKSGRASVTVGLWLLPFLVQAKVLTVGEAESAAHTIDWRVKKSGGYQEASSWYLKKTEALRSIDEVFREPAQLVGAPTPKEIFMRIARKAERAGIRLSETIPLSNALKSKTLMKMEGVSEVVKISGKIKAK